MSNEQNRMIKTYALRKKVLNYILLIPYMFYQKRLAPRKGGCQFITYWPPCEMRGDGGLPGSLPCNPGARWDFSCLKKKKATMNKKKKKFTAKVQFFSIIKLMQSIKCPSPLILINNCLDKIGN